MIELKGERNFSKVGDALPVPDLIRIQTDSYERFLQKDIPPDKRAGVGLEGLLREVFPIVSYDEKMRLEYLDYALDKPRYSPDECRELRLTYGMPFRIRCRLIRSDTDEIMEDQIYLGELPVMIGGGEFIINGAERVVVSQLHRSPGVDFVIDSQEGDRPLHACRVIPERGSWIEMNVTKKDVLTIRIDQSAKAAVTTFLRAMDEKFGTDEAIIKAFYEVEDVKVGSLKPQMWLAADVINPETGEVLVEAGHQTGENLAKIQGTAIKNIKVIATTSPDPLILNTLAEDGAKSHEQALLRIYARLRPGNPPQEDKARKLFAEKFYDPNRYRLGKVGRFRLNRKFKTNVAETEMCLRAEDFVAALQYIMKLRAGEGYVDDIDHLGNRRLRTIDELATEELRKGFLKLRRTVQERMSLKDPNELGRVAELVNSKSVSSAIDYFFGRGELSHVVDQTNPLSQITHERRLSALGPGGLNRKRAGFEVRDVHISHYGRICPIETPEGTNIGLISSLSIYAGVDDYGFLITPYRRVVNGKALGGENERDKEQQLERVRREFLEKEEYPPGFDKDELESLRSLRERHLDSMISRGIEPRTLVLEIEREIKILLGKKGIWGRKASTQFRKRYFEKDPGFVVKWVRADINPEGPIDLGLLESLFIKEFVYDGYGRKFPRLNRGAGKSGKPSGKLIEFFEKSLVHVKSEKGWSPIRDIEQTKEILKKEMWSEEELRSLPDQTLNKGPQGIYFLKPRESDLTFGYIGVSEVMVDRLDQHVRRGDWSINAGEDNTFVESILTDWEMRARESISGKISETVGSGIAWLRADEEMETVIAPADATDKGRLPREEAVLARVRGDLGQTQGKEVSYVDISPKQTVGVSAALIPFLEHDDANRALMGSNMQRQAVPLLRTEPPIVCTGMEKPVAENSGMVVRARNPGKVTYLDAHRIIVNETDEYELRKFVGLNERTCLNQRPIVREGDRVRKGQIIADGAATHQGELALGRNVLVAFMPFDGYNFEDAIVISERLVKADTYTSIHIEEFEVEIRETKLGREEFTRDIPNVSERSLGNLDEYGAVQVGTRVGPGDILVGKVSPKSKTELSPEEKLLRAIFGRVGEDVKNDSLEVPAGTEGIVLGVKRFSRLAHMSDAQKKQLSKDIREYEASMNLRIMTAFKQMAEAINEATGAVLVDPSTRQKVGQSDIEEVILEQVQNFSLEWVKKSQREDAEKVHRQYGPRIQDLVDERKRKSEQMRRGDELPSGVLEMVKVYLATKRQLSVGDKMAGRHGNKGVIARIVPEEDMPFLADGTPIEILLNPLGVPSRMNVGQILETHLGWAAATLGFQAITPVFDGATEQQIFGLLKEANEHVRAHATNLETVQNAGVTRDLMAEMPEDGKVTLFDGRTGDSFEQRVTVGYIYMMKLHHLVDEKIHARSTGPYSLITQQPLGGKARTGGQRFGEMEVWGLEAYGASYLLQELLTVKSDDVEGRTKIYESMVKGNNTLEAGTPVSFDVLCNEIRGLGLNIQLEKKRVI